MAAMNRGAKQVAIRRVFKIGGPRYASLKEGRPLIYFLGRSRVPWPNQSTWYRTNLLEKEHAVNAISGNWSSARRHHLR